LFGKFHVATEGIIDAKRLADLGRRRANILDLAAENDVFDPLLDVIVELIAIVAEELNAIILIRVVLGRKDDACIGAERAGNVGNSGSR
jgi:hypothetical protein